MSKIVCGHCNQPVSKPVNLWVGGQPYHGLCLTKEAEHARLKALLAEAAEALTPFALAASHQMILSQAAFSRAAVVWEKIDAAK